MTAGRLPFLWASVSVCVCVCVIGGKSHEVLAADSGRELPVLKNSPYMGMFGYGNETHRALLCWTRSETKIIMFLHIIEERDISEVTQGERDAG